MFVLWILVSLCVWFGDLLIKNDVKNAYYFKFAEAYKNIGRIFAVGGGLGMTSWMFFQKNFYCFIRKSEKQPLLK